MNEPLSIKELKAMSRASLNGNYGTLIACVVLVYIISYISSILLQMMFLPVTLTNNVSLAIGSYVVYYLAAIIVQLLMSLFTVGFAKLYLNVATGQEVKLNTLFYGFKHQPNKIILVQIIVFAITWVVIFLPTILWFGIGVACYVAMESIPTSIIVLYCILSFFVLFASSFYISIRFALVYYLLADLPTYSAMQIIKLSGRLMKGNYLRYFGLTLSFFGVMLLGILSCGIGFFWVLPYLSTTCANFYLDLMKQRSNIPMTQVEST